MLSDILGYMRPDVNKVGSKIYECFECGSRTEEPNTGTCAKCGGELINLGVSRDL